MPPSKRDAVGKASIAAAWRERPPFWTAWPDKPAVSEVVAHATPSVSQPEGSSSDSCIEATLNACRSTSRSRPSRSHSAARNSRAQGASRLLGSAPPALRAADGLDRASHEPFRRQSSTAAAEALDDSQRRRYCLIIFAGCDSQPPPHRPVWNRSNRRSQTTIRSPILNSLAGRLFVRRHVRATDGRTGLRVGLRPGPDPAMPTHRQLVTLPRRYAGQCRCQDRSRATTTAASTLRMGRRIMANSRRSRTGRGRRYWVRARPKNDRGGSTAPDPSLRAFVRALARQAARECFELELKRRSQRIE